jgi:hypothetical protein
VDPNPTGHLDAGLVSVTRTVLATVAKSLLHTLGCCRKSMTLLRYITHRYARWRSCSPVISHESSLNLIRDMLHDDESAELVLHWNELTSKADVVGALLTIRHPHQMTQLEAETLATKCQAEGYVVIGMFPCETWKLALTASRNESSEVALDSDDDAVSLLACLDMLAARDMILSVRPRELKTRFERAEPVIGWLQQIAGSCDGMKRLVCEAFDRNILTVCS